MEPYSDKVRSLFGKPVHAGTLPGASSVGHADQGVRLQLMASLAGNRIAALRFLAWGCPHLIAATEAFCAEFEGRRARDLEVFSCGELMQSLPVPVEKTGRILVLEDAVRMLGQSLREASKPKTEED